MNVVRSSCDGKPIRLVTLVSSWVCAAAFATPTGAQIVRLAPIGPPVELVDPSERISGNATAGLVLVREGDKIGGDRLWAYLSDPVAAKLKLRISSIDGRYYAEVDYAAAAQARGWVALDLSLREFSFLETNYADPLSEIAAILSDAEAPRFYPVRWGAPHRGATAVLPEAPRNDDPLRVYVNTERAQAFVVVGAAPVYCRTASAVSGFKFNAICDVKLGDLRVADSADGRNVVDGIEVFRRSGVRALAPLALDVLIRY
jgi:hypothetical protein